MGFYKDITNLPLTLFISNFIYNDKYYHFYTNPFFLI